MLPMRFKDCGHVPDKMLKATIYFLRKDAPSEDTDDILRVYDDDEYRDTVRVVYSTPELGKDMSFYFTLSQAMVYISDTLKTLRHDSQPFEYIQVSTAIHPSILYHVSDMDIAEVRHLVEDTVETAIRRPVFRIKKQQ
jgi:hypothetical protein